MNKLGRMTAETDEVANKVKPKVAAKVSRKKVNCTKPVIARNADAPMLLTD